MPGYANWEQLYQEEFQAMTQEGFDTAEASRPESCARPLPFPGQPVTVQDQSSERFWKDAYERLWKIRNDGLRQNYPYVEPVTFEEILTQAAPSPELPPLTEEEYSVRIAGAVYGRIAGVVLGKPLEMSMDRKRIREYLESIGEYPLQDYVSGYSEKLNIRLREDCIPSTRGNIQYVQPDDDIHYTLLALLLAEKKGLNFTVSDVGENWLDNVPYNWFWCASRQAYYKMVNLDDSRPREEQISEIPWYLNPWRECIDGQIRCDVWGYLAPGDPIQAAYLAYKDCSFSLAKNGCYGGMFVAGCIAAALTERPTVARILAGGLSVIPERSRLAEAIHMVQRQYEQTGDWSAVCTRIEETYGNLPFAGTINNLSMTVLALLHGNLDYTKTITTAVMCGIDTDCNGGTAGSICGAAIGLQGIEPRWTEPFRDTIRSSVSEFGQGTITDLIQRILQVHRREQAVQADAHGKIYA